MRKKTIAILAGVGFGLKVLGIIFLVLTFVLAATQVNCINGDCTSTEPNLALIFGSIALLLAGLVVGAIGWVGALVKQANQKQWGWFAGSLASALLIGSLAGDICLLIYLIIVPETPQYPILAYAPDYQPIPGYQPNSGSPMPVYQPTPGYAPMSAEHPASGYQPMPEYPPMPIESSELDEQPMVQYQQIQEQPPQE